MQHAQQHASASTNAWERLSSSWEHAPPIALAPSRASPAVVFGALLNRRGSTHEGAGKGFVPTLRLYNVHVVVDQSTVLLMHRDRMFGFLRVSDVDLTLAGDWRTRLTVDRITLLDLPPAARRHRHP